jgi:single-stranded-DNA-specific exonuclease
LKIVHRKTSIAGQAELPGTLHPVLRRVYELRGITTAEELDQGLNLLLPADSLLGLDVALELLETTIRKAGRILVVGDYDADGATSTALALVALRAYGASVEYLTPNRFEYGYGLTPEIVDIASAREPALIITVDNGISSLTGVDRANELGIPVLVTDHHLPGRQLPKARAIINPNQPDDPFPSKNMAGVGVIFYLMAALCTHLKGSGWFKERDIPPPNPAQWLDLVALGTVADLVPLDRNNRILVEQGLRRIRSGRCRPGIGALLAVSGRSPERLVAADLGYVVGPRLNAAGRLEDMGLGIECLLVDSPEAAVQLAQELDRLNRTRREIEAGMKDQALEWLQRLDLQTGGKIPVGLCLYQEAWHQGVIGILASRIRERYHRPVVAFAQAGDGMLKGSARSVPGLHMRDLLECLAAKYDGLLERFGGHAMAAGLTLRSSDFTRFKQAFEVEAAAQLDPGQLEGSLLSDGELAPEDLDLKLAQQLKFAGPWGQGFPEPMFDGRFQVLQQRVVGEKHLKLLLQPLGSAMDIEGIAFNQADMADLPEQVHLAYRLDVNEYRGKIKPQLIVETIQSIH